MVSISAFRKQYWHSAVLPVTVFHCRWQTYCGPGQTRRDQSVGVGGRHRHIRGSYGAKRRDNRVSKFALREIVVARNSNRSGITHYGCSEFKPKLFFSRTFCHFLFDSKSIDSGPIVKIIAPKSMRNLDSSVLKIKKVGIINKFPISWSSVLSIVKISIRKRLPSHNIVDNEDQQAFQLLIWCGQNRGSINIMLTLYLDHFYLSLS